jgi:hypothetical protein
MLALLEQLGGEKEIIIKVKEILQDIGHLKYLKPS